MVFGSHKKVTGPVTKGQEGLLQPRNENFETGKALENVTSGAASSSRDREEPAVVVRDLTKVFRRSADGSLRALDGLSFEVAPGEIFGLLGPNGAGKSTTLEVIEAIQKPTSGQVHVLGIDVLREAKKIRPRIGVQLQTTVFPERLSLSEILELFASLYDKGVDTHELLTSVGLLEKRKSLLSKLSGGQAKRFSVAASLVNEPDVVFLDEPTSGLDPQGRHFIWDLIRRIRARGCTVILTTHHMDEAQTLCDRVGIIDRGRLMALDTPIALIRRLESAYHIRFSTSQAIPVDSVRTLAEVVRLSIATMDKETTYDLEVHDPARALPEFVRVMGGAMTRLSDIRVEPATLEDVFLALTGRELRD